MESEQQTVGTRKKKERDIDREVTTALFLLRCVQIGLSMNDLETLTIGMIMDMAVENKNDDYDYPNKAGQQDFDRF